MAVSRLLSFLLVLWAAACGSHAARWSHRGLRAPPSLRGASLPPAQWLQQKLDHFNSSDARTWKQRYWVNASHWSGPQGPVFLMIAGEAEANPVWITTGDMMKNAAIYGALAVTVEHRYTGALAVIRKMVGVAAFVSPSLLQVLWLQPSHL